MATIKKGLLTKAHEWAKHLKKWGKRKFWKRERRAFKKRIEKDDIHSMFIYVGSPSIWHWGIEVFVTSDKYSTGYISYSARDGTDRLLESQWHELIRELDIMAGVRNDYV